MSWEIACLHDRSGRPFFLFPSIVSEKATLRRSLLLSILSILHKLCSLFIRISGSIPVMEFFLVSRISKIDKQLIKSSHFFPIIVLENLYWHPSNFLKCVFLQCQVSQSCISIGRTEVLQVLILFSVRVIYWIILVEIINIQRRLLWPDQFLF